MAGQAECCPVTDVTIVGADIIGVCSALVLQERGLSVAIVDRYESGEATSYGNAGIVSPWSCVPQSMPGVWKSVPEWLLEPRGPLRVRLREMPQLLLWIIRFFANTRVNRVHEISDAMYMLTRGNSEAYRRFLKGTGREDLLKDSWFINVYRGKAKPDLGDLGWRLRIDRGAPVEMLTDGELREMEPELLHEFDWAIVIKNQARALAPDEICKAFARKAKHQGAKFLKCDVKRLCPREDGRLDLETDIGSG